MRVLLDTHTLIWWATADVRLSPRAASLINDPNSDVVVSAITALEIAIKSATGKLALGGTPQQFVQDQVVANRFEQLALSFDHALQVYGLPPIHRDPFDRVLVAQARFENIPIVTDDALIKQYPVAIEW